MVIGTILLLDNKRLAMVIGETECILSDGSRANIPEKPIIFHEASETVKQFEEAILNGSR